MDGTTLVDCAPVPRGDASWDWAPYTSGALERLNPDGATLRTRLWTASRGKVPCVLRVGAYYGGPSSFAWVQRLGLVHLHDQFASPDDIVAVVPRGNVYWIHDLDVRGGVPEDRRLTVAGVRDAAARGGIDLVVSAAGRGSPYECFLKTAGFSRFTYGRNRHWAGRPGIEDGDRVLHAIDFRPLE